MKEDKQQLIHDIFALAQNLTAINLQAEFHIKLGYHGLSGIYRLPEHSKRCPDLLDGQIASYPQNFFRN